MWVPEKIAHDCTSCALFRHCGQYAVTLPLRAGVSVRPERPAAVIQGSRSIAPRRPNIERLQLTQHSHARDRTCRGGARRERPRREHHRVQPIEGGITAAARFQRGRRRVRDQGVRRPRPDSSSRRTAPAAAAAVFTTNHAQAAPILVSRDRLATSGGHAAAIVVNSGCANACTGADGMAHAERDGRSDRGARSAVDPAAVLVASTGVIGVKLDMSKVERGIPMAADALVADGRSGRRAARS